MEGVHLKFTDGALDRDRARGAHAQVRRARPARHHGEHHARRDVRHPVAAQHQGSADLRGGRHERKEQPIVLYQKAAETA